MEWGGALGFLQARGMQAAPPGPGLLGGETLSLPNRCGVAPPKSWIIGHLLHVTGGPFHM